MIIIIKTLAYVNKTFTYKFQSKTVLTNRQQQYRYCLWNETFSSELHLPSSTSNNYICPNAKSSYLSEELRLNLIVSIYLISDLDSWDSYSEMTTA